ncbi:MAG: adenylate/guanylate cyclase domain-containing protein [Nitrososphaeraceae archaeon]
MILFSHNELDFHDYSTDCCVGFLDLVNPSYNKNTILKRRQIETYYSKFMNSLHKITKKHNIKIVENEDDCILLYSPSTSNTENIKPFEDFFTCIYTINDELDKINKDLFNNNLPQLNYRISVDYGDVDLSLEDEYSQLGSFGTTVNICSQIDSIYNQSEISIGEKLYKILESLLFDPCYKYQLKIKNNELN